jgi:hypothetical protein
VKASKKTEGKSESIKKTEGITPSDALSIILHLKLFKKKEISSNQAFGNPYHLNFTAKF